MITALPQSSGKTLGFKMSGKLHDEDYKQFVPAVEAAIKANGKVRLLAQFVEMNNRHIPYLMRKAERIDEYLQQR